MAKNNKVYFPKDAIASGEDFDVWFEDGDILYHLEGDWSGENRIAIIGRLGGEAACIKPDFKQLSYYLREGLHTYSLQTYSIFKHYYVEGMIWDIHGSMHNPPLDFITQNRNGEDRRDVHICLKRFRDKGLCYEVTVKDISKLRIAVISAIAILMKEVNRGESKGEELSKDAPRLERIKKRIFSNSSFTFEQMCEKDPEIALIAEMEPKASR